MRYDIIADTHGYLSDVLLHALEGADVIVHAGDICSARDLHRLEDIAPVKFCIGNNDYGYDYGPFAKRDYRFYSSKLRWQVCHYRERLDLAVCDVSFTSIRTILPAVMELLMEEGLLLALVKPQFEAGRSEVGKGGVVSDPVVQLRALKKVAGAFCEAGLVPVAACPSPICGHKGNREFLLLGARTSSQGAHVPQCGRPHQEASAPVALDLKALVYDDACVRVVDVHACPAESGVGEKGG